MLVSMPIIGPERDAYIHVNLTIDNHVCFVVQRASRIISRSADNALRSTGLTVEQTIL